MLDNIRKIFFEAEIKILGFFFMALKLKNCHYRKINEKTLENLQKIVERKKDYNKVNRKRFIISRNEAIYGEKLAFCFGFLYLCTGNRKNSLLVPKAGHL